METSADGVHWQRDARYFYYPHGPLQRTELGAHVVQGTDYAYTLQGWLKGINGDRLNPNTDMGRDGDPSVTNNPNLLVGRDAYALTLGYYGDADYKAIGNVWNTVTDRPFAPIGTSGTLHDAHYALYNGNIAHTVNTLQPFGLWNSGNGGQGQVLAQVYRYDQLNRLKKARGVEGLTSSNTWDAVTDAATNKYRSQYEYDANGNITSVQRYDVDENHYDEFSYKYEKRGGRVVRNRLYQLNDLADQTDAFVNETGGAKDIGYTGNLAFDEEDEDINNDYNYGYDALGNLVRDTREGITGIDWSVAGKVRSVTKATGPSLAFAYGASGQRTQKQVSDPDLDATGYREHYIRDAQGNIMATYRYTNNGGASLKLNERPLYGSSRLGSLRKEEELHTLLAYDPEEPNTVQHVDLNYELTDHLGNVCAVVTGRLLDGNGGGTPKQAELLSAQGYEPFGSLLPGRNYSSNSYNFGFQGQIKDDEIHGATGTSYAFEYRMHDPRIGRFWSVDPLAAKYPHNSPYAFSENRVLDGIELEGLEWQPLAENGDAVAPDANNISCYKWVGYCEVVYNYDGKSHESPPTDPCTEYTTQGIRGPEGTVATAYLASGQNAMEKYTSDPDNLCGNVAYAALQQTDITTIGTLNAALQPGARNLLLRANLDLGVDLRITQAVRTFDEQNNLYAQGRTQAQLNRVGLGHVRARPDLDIVTRARGGQSAHNHGLAFDVARRGSDPWNVNWNALGTLGVSLGMEWGGNWEFQDRPHFQVPNWRNLIPAE